MAARISITQSYVSSLKATGTDQYIRDTRLAGFGVRVNPGGKVVFVVEGRVKRGKPVRQSLGNADTLTVTEARSLAQGPLKLMAEGIDPRKHRVEAEAAEQKARQRDQALAVTLGSVFDRFLVARTLKPKTISVYKSAMRSYFSDWLDRPIREITRQATEARFLEVRETKGQASASMGFRVLSTLCTWAQADQVGSEPLMLENPCDVIKKKRYDRSVAPRTSFLNDHQIDRLLHYAEVARRFPTPELLASKDGVKQQSLNYVLLLLFTGLRKGEGLRLRWADVDFRAKVFTAKNTKNKTDHVVPMSFYVFRIFKDQKAIAGESAFVFPSEKSEVGHMTSTKKQLATLTEASGVSFMLHDLRRTFSTHAARHGVEYEAIKRAINHRGTGVTAQYIQATVETLRPVFEAVGRGYLSYFDEDLARQIYEPEAYAAAEAEFVEDMKQTGQQRTPRF